MSFPTILLIASSCLTLVFTILLFLLGSLKDAKTQLLKKRRRKVFIIALVVSVLTLLTSIVYQIVQNSDRYNASLRQTWNQACAFREDGSYINAGNCFGQASVLASDNNVICQSLINQGDCYLLHGIQTQDKQYIERAVSVYEKLFDSGEFNKNGDLYPHALICLSLSYVCLNDIQYNEKLANLLEEMYDFLPVDGADEYNSMELCYCISRSVTSGWYYELEYRANGNKQDLVIAKGYFEEAFRLEEHYERYNEGEIDYIAYNNMLFCQVGDYLYSLAQECNGTESIGYIHEAINFYNQVIAQPDSQQNLTIGIRTAYGLGQCYISLVYLSPLDKAQNRYNAYYFVQPYICLNDTNLDYEIQLLAPIAIASGYFTESDIECIMARFDRLLAKYPVSVDSNAYKQIQTQLYVTCCFLYGFTNDSDMYKRSKIAYDEFHSILYSLMAPDEIEYIDWLWELIICSSAQPD